MPSSVPPYPPVHDPVLDIAPLTASDLADAIADGVQNAPPSESLVDQVRKWGTFLLSLAIFLAGLYAFMTGKTSTPPGPPPPIPMMSSIPPGHTALIQHDASGRVTMTVSPAAK